MQSPCLVTNSSGLSPEFRTSSPTTLPASHCELEDKVVALLPGGIQLVRGLLATVAKAKQQERSAGVPVSVDRQGVGDLPLFLLQFPGSLLCWDLNFWIFFLLAGLMWECCIHVLAPSTLRALGIVRIMMRGPFQQDSRVLGLWIKIFQTLSPGPNQWVLEEQIHKWWQVRVASEPCGRLLRIFLKLMFVLFS